MGGSLALLPLLNASEARAAALPRRLIVVVSPNGVIDAEWWAAPGNTFTFPSMTQSLEPYKSDVIMLNGVELKNFTDDRPRAYMDEKPSAGGSHDNFPALLTGKKLLRFAAFDKMADGPSIDQYVADGLIKSGVQTPFRSLALGAKSSTGKSDQLVFRAADQPVTPENDPTKVFKALFTGRTLDPASLDKLKADRKSLLDFVARDLTRFGKRLGTEDQAKVQAHLQTIRDIETQVATLTPAACAAPDPGTIAAATAAFPNIIKSQMDLAATALACNLTRVVTLSMNDSGGTLVFDFLGGEFTQPSKSGDFGKIHNTHEIAHHWREEPQLKIQVEQFYVGQVAYLIKTLKSIKEGPGTLLDNTAILYVNNAHDGGAHNSDNLPCFIAGSCGGAFKGGRSLKFSPRVPMNGVLIALANAMGVATQTFGDPAYGGELAGLRS
jgi:hypothetical protein